MTTDEAGKPAACAVAAMCAATYACASSAMTSSFLACPRFLLSRRFIAAPVVGAGCESLRAGAGCGSLRADAGCVSLRAPVEGGDTAGAGALSGTDRAGTEMTMGAAAGADGSGGTASGTVGGIVGGAAGGIATLRDVKLLAGGGDTGSCVDTANGGACTLSCMPCETDDGRGARVGTG